MRSEIIDGVIVEVCIVLRLVVVFFEFVIYYRVCIASSALAVSERIAVGANPPGLRQA